MSKFKQGDKVDLGDECKDVVTSFVGIAIARTEWLNGCARVMLQPPVGKDGKCPDPVQFDEPQLLIIKKQKVDGPKQVETSLKTSGRTGGPGAAKITRGQNV